jgi:hypothetical protein
VIERADRVEVAGAVRSGPEGLLPLSAGQGDVWSLRKVAGPRPWFNVALGLRTGVLDRGALERALGEVSARHESLRTRVAEEHGHLAQVVDGVSRVMLEQVGTVGGPEEGAALAGEFRDRPFDAGRGPLWRAGLIALPGASSILVLAADSLVCDVRSLQVFLTELGLLYDDFAAGRAGRLAPLPVQYRDFARWQQDALSQGAFAAQVEYWRKQLSGATLLELPCDRLRPVQETGRGASCGFVVSREIAAELRAIAARGQATLFMVLLAAFQMLLARHAGQEDVAVGTLVPGPDSPEFEKLIGLFENPVVLRTDLSGDPSFTGLLARVRDVAAGAFSNKDVPFSCVEEAASSGKPVLHPIFQVMFTLRATPAKAGLRYLGAEPLQLPCTSAKWDLSLEMTDPNDDLRGSFVYNTDIFDRSTIQRLAERFTTLLGNISSNPEQPLTELLTSP